MNLTQLHMLGVALAMTCATVLALAHVMASSDATYILVTCIGSISGHAVGYQAGKDSAST